MLPASPCPGGGEEEFREDGSGNPDSELSPSLGVLAEMEGVAGRSELVSLALRSSFSIDGIGSSRPGARLGPAFPDASRDETSGFSLVSFSEYLVMWCLQPQNKGETLTLLAMMKDVSEGRHGGNVGDVWDGVVLAGWSVVGGCSSESYSRCGMWVAERRVVCRWPRRWWPPSDKMLLQIMCPE
jgi:hypothetical protein